MGPALFVIAILGCGDADAPCRQISVEPATYSSLAACTQATDDAAAGHSDADYPVIVAECRPAGMFIASEPRSDEIKLPPPEQGQAVRRASAPARPVRPARA